MSNADPFYRMVATTETLRAKLSKIDVLLIKIDEVLYAIQPYEDGRIGIKFVTRCGVKTPQARRFRRANKRSRKWVSDFVNYRFLGRYIRTKGKFKHNEEFVKILCAHASYLMDLRAKIIKKVSSFYAFEAILDTYHKDKLTDASTKIMDIWDAVDRSTSLTSQEQEEGLSDQDDE